MKKPLNKSEKIKKHLMSGKTINPKQAWDKYGVYRLSSIIHSLRKRGFVIVTDTIKYENGEYGRYKLIQSPEK